MCAFVLCTGYIDMMILPACEIVACIQYYSLYVCLSVSCSWLWVYDCIRSYTITTNLHGFNWCVLWPQCCITLIAITVMIVGIHVSICLRDRLVAMRFTPCYFAGCIRGLKTANILVYQEFYIISLCIYVYIHQVKYPQKSW